MPHIEWLGAPTKPLDLSNPAILKEVKFLLFLLSKISTGDGAWSSADSAAYLKLVESELSWKNAVAHTENGAAVLGFPKMGELAYPSIYGVDLMGGAVESKGIMTQAEIISAFPYIVAYKKDAAGAPPPGAGVIPPTLAPSSTEKSANLLWWVLGGLALVGGAVLLLGAREVGGGMPALPANNPRRRKQVDVDLDKFFTAYVEAALWSSTDESTPSGGEPLDKNYGPSDIVRDSWRKMSRDATAFATKNAELIRGREAQAGHDFWLTRNGHGAGFWDGDWPEPAATILTKASKTFGEQSLYVDRGRIYVS